MRRSTGVFIIALVVLGGMFAFGAQRTMWGPGQCASCHQDERFVSETLAASHGAVECVACHTPGDGLGRLAFGIRHLPVMLTASNGRSTRDLSVVGDSRCLACHEGVYDGVASANGIRVDHVTCARDATCTDCHATTAHKRAVSWVRTYDMETCLECHVSADLADCGLCHDGRLPGDRISTGVFAITHGPEWESTHGMGNPATCNACHIAADCSTCHGAGLPHDRSFLGQHAEISQLEEARCSTCHAQSFCDGCHGLEMPHPAQFIVEHAGPGETERDLCARCHVDSDCTQCHETHVHPGGSIGVLPGGGAE